MPLITRAFIKAGLIFFALSLLTGIVLQIDSLNIPPIIPLFWHMLMLGWITQIIMGVSMWMFPGRKKEESIRNQRFGWIAFAGLNIGLFIRLISEPLAEISNNSLWEIFLIISAVLQFIGISCYVLEIWPRIRSKKQHLRKRKQEM